MYISGLILALTIVLFSIDDIIFDIICLFKKARKKALLRVKVEELNECPPKMLAIVIAAWHEAEVISHMIENLLMSVQYPKSMYHVFIGVYPNDLETREALEEICVKHPNVHMVVNSKNGPTNKADNANNVIKYIQLYEKENFINFSGINLHDAEDVIHPNELKLINLLFEKYDVIQIPVFPIIPMPKLKNIFKFMTSGTYADEFAENHYRTMLMRDSSGAFVPSAGTGFSISRKALDSFGEKDVFPEGSFTEDYKLSLHMAENGFKNSFFLVELLRVNQKGKTKREFIATRSLFPNTFWTAVKQKTRWTYGIAFQSFRLKNILSKKSTLTTMEKYSTYKDWKVKYTNLLVFPSYLVFIYFLVSLFNPTLETIYPINSFSWYLALGMSVLMMIRQVNRFIAVKAVYGIRSACVAILCLPIIPARVVWGNIINFTATARAWKQHYRGLKNKKSKWSKTDHDFLNKNTLKRYHRVFGDYLLERNYIHAETLQKCLDDIKNTETRIGDYLLEKKLVTQEQIAEIVSDSLNTSCIELNDWPMDNQLVKLFNKEMLLRYTVFPLLVSEKSLSVVCFTDISEEEIKNCFIGDYSEITINKFIAVKDEIITAIHDLYANEDTIEKKNEDFDLTKNLMNSNLITAEQICLAISHAAAKGSTILNMLAEMGLCKSFYVEMNVAS